MPPELAHRRSTNVTHTLRAPILDQRLTVQQRVPVSHIGPLSRALLLPVDDLAHHRFNRAGRIGHLGKKQVKFIVGVVQGVGVDLEKVRNDKTVGHSRVEGILAVGQQVVDVLKRPGLQPQLVPAVVLFWFQSLHRLVNHQQVAVLDVEQNHGNVRGVGALKDGLDQEHAIRGLGRQARDAGDVDVGCLRPHHVGQVNVGHCPCAVAHLDQPGRDAAILAHLVNAQRTVDACLVREAYQSFVGHRHIDVGVVAQHPGPRHGRALTQGVRLLRQLPKVVGDKVGEVRGRVGAVLQPQHQPVGVAILVLLGLYDVKGIDDDLRGQPEGELLRGVRVAVGGGGPPDGRPLNGLLCACVLLVVHCDHLLMFTPSGIGQRMALRMTSCDKKPFLITRSAR